MQAAALIAVVLGLALVTGCGVASDAQNAADTGAAAALPVSQTPGDDSSGDATGDDSSGDESGDDSSGDDSGDSTGDEPDEASTQPVPQAPAARAGQRAAAMSEAAFWRLIAETRRAAGNETGRQSELLKNRLTQFSPQAIVEFVRIRHRLDQGAYTWRLWGAAYVIEDGCSDDCFRDFRGYLISLGQGPYQRALKNPDSLASVVQDAEKGNWENADNVAPDAYSSRTGGDFPLDDTDLSGRPRGTKFNENDSAGLRRRYPRLFARFR